MHRDFGVIQFGLGFEKCLRILHVFQNSFWSCIKDKVYYEDFAQSEEKISTNILAERLKRLKQEGLIRSTPDKENRRKIIYSPTSKALDLIPMILEIIDWSGKYDAKTAAPKEFLNMLKKDRKGLALQVRSKFEK